jgi:dethiobiotin synthetase/adenosylmethionine--8-amino-7-oxononanoate aminotransferase
VQHGLVHENNVTVIDSAHSDFYSVSNKSVVDDPSSKDSVLSPQFDGSASWWTQVLGHAHPSLTLAAARASGRYGHVLFPQAVHLPALKLAEKLIHDGPGKGWASRAFFSDNGSTGMEVTLKMAIRAYSSRHG